MHGLFAYYTLFAQQEGASGHHRYTAIKFAPGGLAAGKVTVGGEYNFKYRRSFTLLAGFSGFAPGFRIGASIGVRF